MNCKFYVSVLTVMVCAIQLNAQVGIGTTTPNSTLDIRGSLSTFYRGTAVSYTATITDHTIVYTGTTAATITLPTAATCLGRSYVLKNASITTPTPNLTIATTSSQTIDGVTTWLLNEINETIIVVSNGANWHISSQSLPTGSGTAWNLGGNSVGATKTLGTLSNFDLPFITNNTEKMRLTKEGRLLIGAIAADPTFPEKLLVDAGTTTSYNLISGKGSIDNYLQLNIQNRSSGASASSDVVASADNSTESINFIDMGINSSGYTSTLLPILTGANNAYLYATGNDFVIGNATINRSLIFFTGGYLAGSAPTGNERMRITGPGMVGINTTVPTERLTVGGNIRMSGFDRSIFFDASGDPYAGIQNISRAGSINELMLFSGNDIAGANGADRIRLASHELHFATAPAASSFGSLIDPTSVYGNTVTVPTRMYINQNGNVAIGATAFNASRPEKLLVDAGTSSSYNVISGKGSIDSYLQLNIQNTNSGSAASSDIVATNNTGTEAVNFVNMGINSSGYTSTGILGGANNAYLYSTGNDFIIGNYTDDKALIFFTTTASVGIERMRLDNTGLIPGQDNVYSLGNTTNKWTAAWAVNGTIQTSDLRLKKNIHHLPYGLNEIMKLNPVSYNWIDTKTPGNKIGLIAQDVKKIIPEVVSGNEKTENLGMNYSEMVPVLINAIQELKAQIDELEAQIKKAQKN